MKLTEWQILAILNQYKGDRKKAWKTISKIKKAEQDKLDDIPLKKLSMRRIWKEFANSNVKFGQR